MRCADGRYVTTGFPPRSQRDFESLLEWIETLGFRDEFPETMLLDLAIERGGVSIAEMATDDLARDMRRLREEWGVELVATVLGPAAEPLEQAKRGNKLGILFGGEAQGLERQWVEACDRKVTIPMHHGTDSLNVAVAAGVFLYHFTSVASFR
jgi:tRNA(Leu) C34 or U34 (ribose-2'-O)-methylase TrmL